MAVNDQNMRPKFCSQCGAPLEADSKFCSACGAPVPGESPAAAYEAPVRERQAPVYEAYEVPEKGSRGERAIDSGRKNSKAEKKANKKAKGKKRGKFQADSGDAYGEYPKINPNANWFSNFAYCLKNSKQTFIVGVILIILILAMMFLDVAIPGGKLGVEKPYNGNKVEEQKPTTETTADEEDNEEKDLEEERKAEEEARKAEEEKKLEEERRAEEERIKEEEAKKNDREYLCSYSSDRRLTESDLNELRNSDYGELPDGRSLEQMLINEIYARHGYRFSNEKILAYFQQKDWYNNIGSYSPSQDVVAAGFSSTEKANVEFLKAHTN